MDQLMRFEILGPTRIKNGSMEVAVTAGRERVLLAMLLLQVGRCVDLRRLIDAMWGDSPPRNAASQVHGSVYRLRKRLAVAGVPGQVIVTEPAGYRAQVDPHGVDVWEFRRLRDEARSAAAAGQLEEAKRHYHAALGLWRGDALAGVDSDIVRQSAAALEDERIQALEECVATELALGAAGELVAELTALVRQYPYREGLQAALMQALYRAGRQADALVAYRQARQILHDELGTEPGAELQRLHQAILNRDPDLAARPALHTPVAPAPRNPRELPADVAGFTGRAEALRALDHLLPVDIASPPAPVVISAIAGTAGVGKSALAVHWAHRAVNHFPDGQLYVNLRGYDPDQPMSPADALARFLTALGMTGQDIPLGIDERAARFRSEVAERRMLILLDNAGSVEQVRPLLPGSGTCAVLVTSRDSLSGLVARDGARRVELDLLPLADAIELLRALIGSRVDIEPEAAATLASYCARLPLALRVAAELAAARSATLLSQLTAELGDRQRRLELLDAGNDPYAAVQVVFSWSIHHLSEDAARTFRLLGLHPGPDLDSYATAALTDVSLEDAHRALRLLASAHLLHSTSPGRYGMHDLLRAFATHLTMAEDTDEQRHAALDRLFDYYLATASAAMDGWSPVDAYRRPRIATPVTAVPSLPDPGSARAWLDAERPALVAAAMHTATQGWPSHTIRLSITLYRYLNHGYFADALAIHGYAHRAAQRAGDPSEQAYALRDLGSAHAQLGGFAPAAIYLEQALALFRQAGDRTGEAIALTTLGVVEERLGRSGEAVDHFGQALAIFRRAANPVGEASVLAHLGLVEERVGRCASAADHLKAALALFHGIGDPHGEAHALNSLGVVEQRLGHFVSATGYHLRALALLQGLGNTSAEATVLDRLGMVDLRLGQPERAIEHFEQALTRFRDIADQDGEAWALNGLGEASSAAGHPLDSLVYHANASAIAGETGTRDQEGRAHAGLGDAHFNLGDTTRARAHYKRGLAIYDEVAMPEAEEVRAKLARVIAADGSGDP